MSNPIMSRGFSQGEYINAEPMTINGTINKLFIMFAILLTSFGVVWNQYSLGFVDKVGMLTMVGVGVGFVLALIISFTRKAMNVLVPIYAFCEGMALGGISAMFNASMPGIVSQAVAATFFTLFALLFAYKAGLIKATEKFRSTIIVATLGICATYLVAIVLSLFGIHALSSALMSSSSMGIALSALVCIIAALNLIIDFDFIEHGAQNGYGKDMEWYGAFGLMVTLVWLYIEILKLLAKLNSRNN